MAKSAASNTPRTLKRSAKPASLPKLQRIVAQLRDAYGPVAPPPADSAFALVLWEKVAYLATDEKRAAAFSALKKRVGLTPRAILDASRGYGHTDKNYTRMYRSAADAARADLADDFDWLIDAHVYLRHHGQETCKTSAPRCDACVVRPECAYGSRGHRSLV